MDGSTYVSGYDPWANLKEITVSQCSAPMLSLGVDGGNHVTNPGFTYDAAGNTLNDGANQYIYDAENRIQTANGVNYTYDGDGKRVKKDTGTLYWTGTGSDPLAESDLSGNMTEEYVFFNGKRIARADVTNNQITAVHYYFSDHLGSASVVTDAQGSGSCWDGFSYVEEESDFYPFGGERVICAGVNHYKFTGKERDSETGLDDFGARYYNSNLGRWITPDWSAKSTAVPYAEFADPQSLNLYGYERNNPLAKPDLDGHCDGTGVTPCDELLQNFQFPLPSLRGAQAMGGGGQILFGIASIASLATGEPGPVLGVTVLMAGPSSFVSGTTNVMGAVTNTNVAEATTALAATQNPAGLLATAGSQGDMQIGRTASLMQSASMLGLQAAHDPSSLTNPAAMAKAANAVVGVSQVAQQHSNAPPNSSPTTTAPSPPPPPPPPTRLPVEIDPMETTFSHPGP